MKFTIALVAAVSAFAEAAQYKSGAVTGFEKFTYGKFITRMRAPDKKGTVSSFFTYWNGPDFYPGGWNELDIEIVPSVSKNPFSMNVIFGDGHTKRETHDYKPSFDPKNDWHIYEMAWTPEFIAWSIDNKEVRRVTKDDPSIKFTDKPQSVMMNFWTPTFESWGKGFDAKDMPWEVEYDYVETYVYNSETSGFDFNWRDNFNTFDTSRWHKSDNTTFDANSTTFRASQAFIKEGKLVLKMEPDHAADVHGEHRFDHPQVEHTMTMPTPEHRAEKGKKTTKSDEHYDIAAEKHYSSMRREDIREQEQFAHRPRDPYEHQEFPGYAYETPHGGDYSEYMRHADPYAAEAYGHRYPTEEFGQHFNPYMEHEEATHGGLHFEAHDAEHKKHEAPKMPVMPEDPYHYNPYSHPQPPKTKAEAEKHMGPEAALFYKEMHNLQKQTSPSATKPTQAKQQKKNFVTDLLDSEETPYEHDHPMERFEKKTLIHGVERHPDAHFDQGYWDLKDHQPHLGDEGHFAGEEHGEYHYVEPERTHAMGHYYSYADEREHHPQHVDEHHDSHGIEHHPDDWKHDTRTHYVHHDEYRHIPEHSYEGDFELLGHHAGSEDFRHDDAYNHGVHRGDTYGHDVDEHDGQGLMHDMEHEFDELFHEMEHRTLHGVEHHDIHYTTLHKAVDHEEPKMETDFHADAHYPEDHHYEHQRHHEGRHEYAAHEDHHSMEHHQIEQPLHEQPTERKESEKSVPAGKKLHFNDEDIHDFVHQMLSTSSFAQ